MKGVEAEKALAAAALAALAIWLAAEAWRERSGQGREDGIALRLFGRLPGDPAAFRPSAAR